jgi:predicted O-methyltransferase YrrM
VVKKAAQATTRAIQKFNKLAYASDELFPVLVPLRDGVLVCRKN